MMNGSTHLAEAADLPTVGVPLQARTVYAVSGPAVSTALTVCTCPPRQLASARSGGLHPSTPAPTQSARPEGPDHDRT